MRKALYNCTAIVAVLMLGSYNAQAETTLSFLVDNGPDSVESAEAVVHAFEQKHPDIRIELEQRPSGGEGDNIVKTRLSTGEMTDLFVYNTGSQFQTLSPARYLLDIADTAGASRLKAEFRSVVTSDGKLYGVPFGPAMGGGIIYNRRIYDELHLKVPTTWDEFMDNNNKIKAAGKVAVAQTYRDTWTSQLIVLGDFYNVAAATPSFAQDYTANKAKYATTPAALRSFEKLEQLGKGGFFNEDFGAATLSDGLELVATGKAAHYPMLSFAIELIGDVFPDNKNDVGYFPVPGDSPNSYGLTVWMPSAVFAAAKTKHPQEVKVFMDFVTSADGCTAQLNNKPPQGPFMVDGCVLPSDSAPAIKDMMPFFETKGASTPALEYVSPVKGPALEQITVEVGSGVRNAADAATLYDDDVRKQARQLGLPNW